MTRQTVPHHLVVRRHTNFPAFRTLCRLVAGGGGPHALRLRRPHQKFLLARSVMRRLRDGGQLLDRLADDVEGLAEVRLGDDQRRREADDVAVRGLGLLD